MERQLREVEHRLPDLKQTVRAADRSFEQGYLEASTYIGLKQALETQETEAIRLRASLSKAQGALQVVLGLPLELPPQL